MNIIESIGSAISSVFSNKMRSILTMLGIIIGISSVIMITSIGGGVQDQTNSQFAELGLDAIQIWVNGAETESDYLTMKDIELLKMPKNVTFAAPRSEERGEIKLRNPNEKKAANVTGTTEEYNEVQPVKLLLGRFIMEIDVQNKSRVALIDSVTAVKLFGRENAVGEKIEVEIYDSVYELEVIGITEGIDYGPFYDPAASVFIPISTLSDIVGHEYIFQMYVKVENNDIAKQTITEINMLLEMNHNNQGEERYYIQNLKDQADMVNNVMGYITTFIAFVAAISLVVGGIGVMNIMLVTVTERTREIGIRKSLGATNRNIQFQFLVEAMILTIIGGFIGILIGYGGGFLVGKLIKVTPTFSPAIVIGTVIISSLVGIIFGVYPASKAAKLDPIEALRYE